MPRTTIALVAVACLSSGIAIGTLCGPRPVSAAKEAEKHAPPKIAYVNIAKVLREFERARANGAVVNRMRQEWLDKAKPLAEALAQKSRDIQGAVNPAEIEAFKKEAQELSAKLEEMNKEAERELNDARDRAIVAVYTEVRKVITEIAEQRGLDVVECYPDSSNPEEERKPVVAQMKLQSPGLIPFYVRKEFDITDDVIAALNNKPPAKGALAPPFTN